MRAGLFWLLFALMVIGASLTASQPLAFVLLMSAAAAAVGSTVMTADGRQALRRIRGNLRQGWSRRPG